MIFALTQQYAHREDRCNGFCGIALEMIMMSLLQIRKMVGLAIYVLKYKEDNEQFSFIKAMINDTKRRYVPLAPSLGLMLERYDSHTALVSVHNFSSLFPFSDVWDLKHGVIGLTFACCTNLPRGACSKDRIRRCECVFLCEGTVLLDSCASTVPDMSCS